MKNARREADSLSEALRAVTIPGSRSAGESGMAPAGEDPVLDDSQPGSSADAESGFRRSRVEILEKPVRYRQSKVAPTGSVNPYASMVESGL